MDQPDVFKTVYDRIHRLATHTEWIAHLGSGCFFLYFAILLGLPKSSLFRGLQGLLLIVGLTLVYFLGRPLLARRLYTKTLMRRTGHYGVLRLRWGILDISLFREKNKRLWGLLGLLLLIPVIFVYPTSLGLLYLFVGALFVILQVRNRGYTWGDGAFLVIIAVGSIWYIYRALPLTSPLSYPIPDITVYSVFFTAAFVILYSCYLRTLGDPQPKRIPPLDKRRVESFTKKALAEGATEEALPLLFALLHLEEGEAAFLSHLVPTVQTEKLVSLLEGLIDKRLVERRERSFKGRTFRAYALAEKARFRLRP